MEKKKKKISKGFENTEGKREIARYEQFLLFPQCFQKSCTADRLKKQSLFGKGLTGRLDVFSRLNVCTDLHFSTYRIPIMICALPLSVVQLSYSFLMHCNKVVYCLKTKSKCSLKYTVTRWCIV